MLWQCWCREPSQRTPVPRHLAFGRRANYGGRLGTKSVPDRFYPAATVRTTALGPGTAKPFVTPTWSLERCGRHWQRETQNHRNPASPHLLSAQTQHPSLCGKATRTEQQKSSNSEGLVSGLWTREHRNMACAFPMPRHWQSHQHLPKPIPCLRLPRPGPLSGSWQHRDRAGWPEPSAGHHSPCGTGQL